MYLPNIAHVLEVSNLIRLAITHYEATCIPSHPSEDITSDSGSLIEEDLFEPSRTVPKDFVDYFDVPAHLLEKSYRRSNGFFGYEESHDNLKLKRLSKIDLFCVIRYLT